MEENQMYVEEEDDQGVNRCTDHMMGAEDNRQYADTCCGSGNSMHDLLCIDSIVAISVEERRGAKEIEMYMKQVVLEGATGRIMIKLIFWIDLQKEMYICIFLGLCVYTTY